MDLGLGRDHNVPATLRRAYGHIGCTCDHDNGINRRSQDIPNVSLSAGPEEGESVMTGRC